MNSKMKCTTHTSASVNRALLIGLVALGSPGLAAADDVPTAAPILDPGMPPPPPPPQIAAPPASAPVPELRHAPAPVTVAQPGPVARGFALLLNVGTSPSGFRGELFGGFKRGRWLFGLGVDFAENGVTRAYTAGPNQSSLQQDTALFLVGPGVQLSLAGTADGRVELFGALSISAGKLVSWNSQSPALPTSLQSAEDTTDFRLSWNVGPGLRWWTHPRFALHVAAGLAANHDFLWSNGPSGRFTQEQHSFTLFGNLGALGVF